MITRLPRFTRNFFFLAGMFFVVWMLFIDVNDLVSQYQLSRKLQSLEQQRTYYIKKIEEVKEDRHQLMSNKALLEKFAREKYLMKKASEDLYLIVEE